MYLYKTLCQLNEKMRNTVYILILLLISGCIQSESKWTQKFEEVNMEIEFPNKSWYLANKWEMNTTWNRYKFELNSTENSHNESAQVWVTIKNADSLRDVLSFLEKCRHAEFKEAEYFFINKSDLTNIDNSIGYKIIVPKAKAIERSGSYSVYTIRQKRGIIIDFVYSGSSATEKQMMEIMKSVTIE